VKRLIADGVAVAIAGSREEAPAIAAEHVREMGSAPLATVWGFGFRTTPVQAAYANAVSMHVLDFEPMSSPPTHAVSPTVPAALAMAEALGASGREVVAACAKGFELQGRVLLASSHARGSLPFHTPGVVGVMGSTAAAAHLLDRLTETRVSKRLGVLDSRDYSLKEITRLAELSKLKHKGADLEHAAERYPLHSLADCLKQAEFGPLVDGRGREVEKHSGDSNPDAAHLVEPAVAEALEACESLGMLIIPDNALDLFKILDVLDHAFCLL